MHNNYYFLRQLSASLEKTLSGTVVSECFSQHKNELVIRFETRGAPFFVKAALDPAFSCLSFPENFHRARRNSVDLFQKLIGHHVQSLQSFANERSFAIHFQNQVSLLFKMHGNRCNLVLLESGVVTELFQNNQAADDGIRLDALDRTIDWSRETFMANRHQLPSIYFTFGKVVWKYLAERGFDTLPADDQWQQLLQVRQQLENPVYRIVQHHDHLLLSLLPWGETVKEYTDPVRAVNEFFLRYTQQSAWVRERAAALASLRTQLHGSENYRAKAARKLAEVESDTNYKTWADLLMANLHAIPAGMEKITLPDFYREGHTVDIKLRKDLSPQKNAEIFYRKAKNQHIEVQRLKLALEGKEKEIERLTADVLRLEDLNDLKALREFTGQREKPTAKKADVILPYHEFEHKGYRIWVGRNAQSNDVLTFKYGYKEDLWLHVKDVPGSHVLVKHQAGKNFPKDVIERAAELAAYNSKRRTESLCPVVVTPRKFVRKRKGDPPGAVVVEKEEVIMVQPRL